MSRANSNVTVSSGPDVDTKESTQKDITITVNEKVSYLPTAGIESYVCFLALCMERMASKE